MRVTAFLPTHDLPEESMPWIMEARDVFDGLVIFIDEKRVTPGTVARAEKVGTRIHYHNAETWYEWDLGAMGRMCGSDWAFMIERDEQLCPEWRQGSWRRILETTQCTHFWCPRRWVVSGGRYITADPWWPDFQLRLFRNNVPGATFPTRLHDAINIPGPPGYLRNLGIHHHVLWLCSRAMREDRVRYYEQLRPAGALGHYYLPELYHPPEASLPEPAKLDVDREIISMDKLTSENISKIALDVSNVPREEKASALFWLDAQVTNATNQPLYPLGPYPVLLAYHWMEKTTHRMVVFDGDRSGLFPGLGAKTTGQYPMKIIAPDQPGEYILQTTIVQDGNCWFENIRPEILQEFVISVTAG